MTRRLSSLQVLSRWRGLQETQAAETHRRRSDEEGARDRAHAALEAVAVDLAGQRTTLVSEGLLDFARIDLLADFEARARDAADAAHVELVEARESTAAARTQHLHARSALRLATDAREAVAASEALRREKTEFDQLTDLLAGRTE